MSVFYQGRVLVIGGESIQQTVAHNETEGLDPNTGTWVTLPPLLAGRQGTGAILFNNRIYVAGGVGNRGGNPKLTTQEFYSLASNPVFPVAFLSFSARANSDQAVELTWTIALEGATDRFEIERSIDGVAFASAGKLSVEEGLDGTFDFDFLDPSPFKGLSYYRIRQIGLDGSHHYSSTQAITLKEEGVIFYPNPMGEEKRLFIEGQFPTEARLIIHDLRGREVFRSTLGRSNQPTAHQVDLYLLPAGIYSASIVLEDRVVTQRIIMP